MMGVTTLSSSVASTQNERVAAGEQTITRLDRVRVALELRPLLANELVARQEVALASIEDPAGPEIEATVTQAARQVDQHLGAERVAELDTAITEAFGGMDRVRDPYIDDEFAAISIQSPHHVLDGFVADGIDQTLIDILSSLSQVGATDLSGHIEIVRAFDDLVGDQVGWTTTVAVSELDEEGDLPFTYAALAVEANDDVRTIAARHPDLIVELDDWDQIVADTERRLDGTATVADRARLDVLTGELQQLRTVNGAAIETIEDLKRELDIRVRDARQRAWMLAIGSWVLMAAAMLGVFIVARSIDKPLIRLRDQARRIIGGDLRAETGKRSGPPELVEIGTSLDELVDNLNGLARRAEAVARGDFDQHTDADDAGPLATAVSATVDRLRQLTTELRSSEQRAQTIVDAAADPILVLDPSFMIELANPAAVALLRGEDLTGLPASAFFRDWQVEIRDGEQIATAVDGTKIDVSLSMSTTEDVDGLATVVLCRDITEQKAIEAKLAHEATHDPLTSLLNRAGIMDRLDAIGADDPVGVMFLDLDKFKPINDTHGHEAGDEVLTEIGRRLDDAVRGDEAIGRLGGDEFVVIVPGAWELEQLAARLVHVVEQPIALSTGIVVSVGTSVGITEGWGGDSAELLRQADEALYACKHERRMRISAYTAGGVREVEFHGDVSRIIAEAIGRDELVLAALPIVDLTTGYAVGYELLVRWDHPDEGLIQPGAFLPITEQSDAVLQIDQWVLRAGLRWAADRPGPWGVSLNMSTRHLEHGDLVFVVETAIAQTGIDPARVQLEFSEPSIERMPEHHLPVLERLRSLGVRVARDDATDARSDDAVHAPRFDAVKIDIELVRLVDRAEGRHRIAAIVDRSHRAGQAVVAEGVETAEQAEALQRLGIRFAQGFHYGQPVLIRELAAYL